MAALAVTMVAAPLAIAEVPPQAAWVLFDLRAGGIIHEARPDVLDTAVQPGSLMKIVTLAAAIDSGLVTQSTRLSCPRLLRVRGHVLDCAHPDLGHPLSPGEALAYSCNGFLAQVAPRVSRAQLDVAARRLGLPPVHAASDPVLAALGLDVYRVPPRRWLDVLGRLQGTSPGGATAGARAIIREGLRAGAQVGTASALAGPTGLLAKTGTAAMPAGGVEGLAIVLDERADGPRGLVVVAPGGSGRDAATLAAGLLTGRGPGSAQAAFQTIRLGVTHDGGFEVRQVPLEDYVADVVAGEAPARGPEAAREGMAIAARTVAAGRRGRHERDGFDVCDTTHCQVVRPATAAARAAANRTAGLVLTWQGHVAEIYYAASCGGVLADPGLVWPGRLDSWPAYLSARPDPAGSGAHEVRWEAEMAAAEVGRVLRTAGMRGEQVADLAVQERDVHGRARLLKVAGFSPDTIRAEAFRMAAGRAAGWALLKSTWFDLVRTANGYRFSGQGLGHGVGLCVRGAAALAARGADAEGLLRAYFPGTAIEPLEALAKRPARGIVRVVLPRSEEQFRTGIEGDASRFLLQVSARLGLAPPAAITIHFHPTVASYQRATGRPWWTSGTTSDTRIDLIPAPALAGQRQLERSMRHEIVHALTVPSMRGRPLWVLEGLARYFTWASNAPPRRLVLGGQSCPDDGAFAAAGSARDLDVLYERSAACVERALGAGRNWRELP